MPNDVDPNTIVRCWACDISVRAYATTVQTTGEYGDIERWCLSCVQDVDQESVARASHVASGQLEDKPLLELVMDNEEEQDAFDQD